MPGSASLDANVLIDDLVADIDEIREEVFAEVGSRQYAVFTVLRTWSGEQRGEGEFDDVETELTPAPRVQGFRRADRLLPSGLDEADVVRVTEISLSYTEAELAGGDLDPNQQWLIRVKDQHGQGVRDRDFVLEGSPTPDRERDIGWAMGLRRASDAGTVW